MSEFYNKTLLITGACGVTSRTIVRALRRSPYFRHTRLIGTDVCDNPYGIYEGLYARIYRVPGVRDGERYRSLINKICLEEKVDAAIVVPELEVLYWTENQMPVPAHLPPVKFSREVISKANLYEMLQGTGFVPEFAIRSRDDIIQGNLAINDQGNTFPVWLRDCSPGSTSGKGAICIQQEAEAAAWMALNSGIQDFMISEFLPGRNLACLLLYHEGKLLKVGCYERLEYFMAKTVISGVSGNISKGRLINDPVVVDVSTRAIEAICKKTGEIMHGMVTVDLRTDGNGSPKITEINLRQVAAASAFSEVPGANLAEAQALVTLGASELTGPVEVNFPPNNLLLRDIDGAPLFIPDYTPLEVGACR